MLVISGIQFTFLEISLFSMLIGLAITCVACFRRMTHIEHRLQRLQHNTHREISMVNQGAIGIGRRLAKVELNLKKPANVANFAAPKDKSAKVSQFESVAQSIKPTPIEQPVAKKISKVAQSTRAEQALSAWINENQTA